MKKHLLIFCTIFIGFIAQAQNNNHDQVNSKTPSVINALDTVIFDLSKAVVTGSHVEFPVLFRSDDVVNALDFSMKYDQINFLYDSIYSKAYYITSSSFYNSADQTIRFTSNSFHNYTHDTVLVTVRFTMLNGINFCSADLNTISVYLNGDPCSFKVVNCLSTGINDIMKSDKVKVFPNPASDKLIIETPSNAEIQLFDLSGRMVLNQTSRKKSHELNIQNLPNGIYILKIFNNTFSANQKLVIKN
jgi:hypothetical protein